MLLIVAHHYVVNSGLLEVMNQNILSSNTIFFSLFGAWGKTGIVLAIYVSCTIIDYIRIKTIESPCLIFLERAYNLVTKKFLKVERYL